ncbi:helix-turn-helix domain-containing protein [Paenibacillus sp. LHD-117]|uniref:helix-turn-helix transcriptional regulator n=1 Tax=Paenibacillus sp. LHD-117 TaxID=3071412 RepID=UPI0027DFADDA|nr:helix-turn-helix domain-containing protein [Paenibacillus sp. LHD-117]MDQ6422617.1 helix-turn-helix domain-containing protein [Paenibacillus sp. LHD-117]
MDHLLNQSQVAKRLGVSRTAISRKLQRKRENGKSDKPFPEPDAFNNSRPLWTEETIDEYKANLERQTHCPSCGNELEDAEYLDNDQTGKFDSARICMNEYCDNKQYY